MKVISDQTCPKSFCFHAEAWLSLKLLILCRTLKKKKDIYLLSVTLSYQNTCFS